MYNTSQTYKDKVLEDSTQHTLKLYINDNLVNPDLIFDFSFDWEMFSDEIYLGATPKKSCSFKVHKDAISEDDYKVRVISGIEEEEVPMGTYTFEKIKEVDDFTYEITAVDYMSRFEGKYETDLDFTNGVTLMQVLQDLCEKSEVELGTESFKGDDVTIAVYDSTLQRKEFLSYIAEQAGGFAIIDRDDKLYIKSFNHTQNASELNLNYFKTYKYTNPSKISKISYEDGIQDYDKGNDTESTLWLAQKNMYITSQEQIDNVYDELMETERTIQGEGTNLTLENTRAGIPLVYEPQGRTEQFTTTGKNISYTTEDNGNAIKFLKGNEVNVTNPTTYYYNQKWNLQNDTSKSGKTYTIYTLANGTVGDSFIDFQIGKTGQSYAFLTRLSANTTYTNSVHVATVTLAENEVFTAMLVNAPQSVTANVKIKLMIVEGNYTAQTIGDYEPYTRRGISEP